MDSNSLPLETSLPDDPVTLQSMIRELLATLKERDQQLQGIQHRLDQLLKRLFGPRAERFHPDQPTLFDDIPVPDVPPVPTTPTEAEPPPRPTTRRKGPHGRKPLPSHLPRRRVEHDLSEAEKTCPCCQQMRKRMGELTSEQLDYQPASLFVVEHVRWKYVCERCSEQADPLIPSTTPALLSAPKPAQPIDKGLPGPGLLAHIITSKYADHLPLHRQEGILARHGVELSRSTLCDWMAACANLLTPLYQLLVKQVLGSRVIHTDDTVVPVLEPGLNRTKTGRLWVYIGDRDHAATVYEYTPTHARTGPMTFLKEYRGFLQADAFSAYDGIYAPGAIIEVACWAHARRYFHEARTSDPLGAHEALARIRGLYAVEKEAEKLIDRDRLTGELADAVRLHLRTEQTLPLLINFGLWLEEQHKVVLPKSPMGQAIGYALHNWTALKRFTEAGLLNIDNNAAERALRCIAVGRKNWMFAGSDRGGKTAAILYTFVGTCKHLGIEPFGYLRDVLARLPATTSTHHAELLPQPWAMAQCKSIVNPSCP